MNGTGNMIIAEDICDTESSAYVCSDVTQLMYGHGQDDYDWVRTESPQTGSSSFYVSFFLYRSVYFF